jgi:excisionase family DNA binding protein
MLSERTISNFDPEEDPKMSDRLSALDSPRDRGHDRTSARRSVRQLGEAELPRLLNIDDVAEYLGVTPRHIRRLVAERRIPYLKVGRFVRFDPAAVAAWLDKSRREPGDHWHGIVRRHGRSLR